MFEPRHHAEYNSDTGQSNTVNEACTVWLQKQGEPERPPFSASTAIATTSTQSLTEPPHPYLNKMFVNTGAKVLWGEAGAYFTTT
jgi:hypothetical protein